jgi:hypothetical protein
MTPSQARTLATALADRRMSAQHPQHPLPQAPTPADIESYLHWLEPLATAPRYRAAVQPLLKHWKRELATLALHARPAP